MWQLFGRMSFLITLSKCFLHHLRPERMVVAGVGVEHDTLVAAVQRHFVDSEPAWGRDTKVVTDRSVAQYTG